MDITKFKEHLINVFRKNDWYGRYIDLFNIKNEINLIEKISKEEFLTLAKICKEKQNDMNFNCQNDFNYIFGFDDRSYEHPLVLIVDNSRYSYLFLHEPKSTLT